MKVTLSWLREFAPIRGTADEVAEDLAELGLPVEDRADFGAPVPGVVTARILDVRAHPKADRIRLVDVDTGDGSALQIACGAPNLFVDDIVALATVGTTMPDGMVIAARAMRGEMSNGMICSARELGLGDEHDGIMVLGRDLPLGVDAFELLGLAPDVMFDLDVTPNRPEALSIVGVARDVAARQGVPFTLDVAAATESSEVEPAAELLDVRIDDSALCGRFVARVLSGIKIAPSPAWLAARLRAAGMRPINNVVDVSNYVMIETGQPSHAFDLDRIEGSALVVRSASVGETLVTLDGRERSLSEADGVIVDGNDRPVALAGVMGGETTEVADSTTRIVVEMAWWQPDRITDTVVRHRLPSDASLRFRRGTDPARPDVAMNRFIELLAQTTDVVVHRGVIDERGELPPAASISVRPDRVSAYLGVDLGVDEITDLLAPLGFEVTGTAGDVIVAPPGDRPDVQIEVDVIEEVARMFGYSALPLVVPRPPQTGSLSSRQRRTRRIRAAMLAAQFNEVMPMPFLAPSDLAAAGLDPDGFALANPLVADESILRTSLLPGLVKTIAYNEAHQVFAARLYEIGHVFPPGPLIVDTGESSAAGKVLSTEAEVLAFAAADGSLADTVGAIESALESIGCGVVELVAGSVPGLHPGRSAEVHVDGTAVGVVGEVHPSALDAFGVSERVAYGELWLDDVLGTDRPPAQAAAVSRFPAARMDLSLVLDESVPAARLVSAVRSADPLVAAVRLFDVFRSEQIGTDRKSVSVGVELRAVDRTLTDAEIHSARSRIIETLAADLKATLRS